MSKDDPDVALYRVKAPSGGNRAGRLEEVERVQGKGWARLLGPAIKRLLGT